MTNFKICEAIKKYRDCIYEKLKNRDHFERYFKITKKYKLREIDSDFEQAYAHFYKLNGPGGLSAEQRDLYFTLIKDNSEANFSAIMRKMYDMPRITKKGVEQHRLFLSFTTKLLHTKNKEFPIYDSNVASILGDLIQVNLGTFEERLQNREEIFENLKTRIGVLLNNECIIGHIAKIREYFKKEPYWDDSLISDTKILDSILWALYTCQNEKKKNKA